MVVSMVDEVVEVAEGNEQIEAKEISYTSDEDGSTHDSTVFPLSLPPLPHLHVGRNAYLQVRVASQHVKIIEPPLKKKPAAYSASCKGLQLLKMLRSVPLILAASSIRQWHRQNRATCFVDLLIKEALPSMSFKDQAYDSLEA
ncbi:hypothetical protein Tco_1138958 [Tanacetum coccineum]